MRFGHGIGRTDLAGQQRLEPTLFLGGGSNALENFHIAGIGRGAVHGLGGHAIATEDGCNVGIVEVLQAFAGFGIGQEEIPQTFLFRLILGGFEQFELTRRVAPAISTAFAELFEFLGHRLDRVGDKSAHMLEQRHRCLGHTQIVKFVEWVQTETGLGFHCEIIHRSISLMAVYEFRSPSILPQPSPECRVSSG